MARDQLNPFTEEKNEREKINNSNNLKFYSVWKILKNKLKNEQIKSTNFRYNLGHKIYVLTKTKVQGINKI